MQLLFFLFFSHQLAFADTVVTYSYSKAPGKPVKTITFKELQQTYTILKSQTFNAPGPKTFFDEFLRFKLGVEVALHEKALVKSADIIESIVNPPLRTRFEHEIYKALAELKLRKQMKVLDEKSSSLSDKTLKSLYAKDPEFNFFYISFNHPVSPNAAQIKEAESRAKKVSAHIRKSKKEFTELVRLNSDEQLVGVLPVSRSRGTIPPNVYRAVKAMKSGQISAPIRVATGYWIVKLNEKTPFSRANKMLIKADYFNERRTKIHNDYFNGLRKQFSVKIVNQKRINGLR